MGGYQVQPPEAFNFSRPEEWARRFKRFRKASGLAEKDEEAQVNTLVYSMGDEADDILHSFGLSTDDAKKYDVVKARFDGHFVNGHGSTSAYRSRVSQWMLRCTD